MEQYTIQFNADKYFDKAYEVIFYYTYNLYKPNDPVTIYYMIYLYNDQIMTVPKNFLLVINSPEQLYYFKLKIEHYHTQLTK